MYFPTRIRTGPWFLREGWLLVSIGGLLMSTNYSPILEQEEGLVRIRVRKNNATEELEKEDGCERGKRLSSHRFDGRGQTASVLQETERESELCWSETSGVSDVVFLFG